MKRKLWLNLFIKVAAIFATFVIVVCIANSTLLVHYYTHKQEKILKNKSLTITTLDLNNKDVVNDTISEISEKYNVEIEIYEQDGRILYTTRSSQMMDFINPNINQNNFYMRHEPLEIIKRTETDDGAIIETAVSPFNDEEFLLCKREVNKRTFEIRIRTQLLESSAAIAGEFVSIIAFCCFVFSLIWVFFFARKFSFPITEMSKITEQMSELDFSQKVLVKSTDEIGVLGQSINNLSDKLDSSLSSLRDANEKLQHEIELEHQLDVMRKGFIANVSHELKTPLAIISGYAEGLKLNINSESKNNYCDTIMDEAGRMNKLVLRILELSKYESSQIPEIKESFDISLLASNILNRISKTRTDITTVFNIPNDTLVYSDIVNTEQILKSLLENAYAHANENGSVRIESSQDNEDLRISIYNSGKKIEPEIMPHIWESFFRGDTSHSRNEGRFGLGLSIVSAIIKSQNKRCGVYNTEDGVCFWFTIEKQV